MCNRNPIHCVVPPRLLERLLTHEDRDVRSAAMATLIETARLRGQRELLAQTFAPVAEGGLNRNIFDAKHNTTTGGKLVRSEGTPTVKEKVANEAYDGLGVTYTFYDTVFHRDSIDGHGLRLDGVVHYGHHYNNAFWNGARMIFGDGDGKAFFGFTKAIDIIGHELTHGVTEFTCNLEYHQQSGALNESMSDVFGSLVKQFTLKQTVEEADWLIGSGVLGPAIKGKALRSLKDPGSAFDGDDQPSNMSGFVNSPDTSAGDFGGVHTNSGIPNHAFYLLATALGGHAWEEAGQIYYETLLALKPTSDFKDCATVAYQIAGKRFGTREQEAVGHAFSSVGVEIDTQAPVAAVATAPKNSQLKFKLKEIAAEVERAVELV